MLASVHVENIAVIKNIDISLDGGFTVLTGETGAGKSILVDSLCLLCGARSDRDVIRTGESFALVEGVFADLSPKAVEAIAELGFQPDEDGLLVLSRRISADDGRAVAKINSRTVTAARLREVAAVLVGIHGQQETQTLAEQSKQLETLDSRASNEKQLAAYRAEYEEMRALEKQAKELRDAEDEKAARSDYLRYRRDELQSLSLHPGEEEKLAAEKTRLAAGEKIIRLGHEAITSISGGNGISARAESAIKALEPLKGIVPEAEGLIERLSNIKYEAEDITDCLYPLTESDGADSTARLDAVEERLLNINSFKRKYRVTSADELIDKLESIETELSTLDSAGEKLKAIEKQLSVRKKTLSAAAEALTDSRKTAAKQLETEIKETLEFLDMPSAVFIAETEPKEFSPDGADAICFKISANKGEEPRPIGKIASGGELSRIMLAIKRSLAAFGNVDTMIFDEIDSGISGATSDKIGMLLCDTAHESGGQVVCVTHSALLASHADRHLLISKRETDGRVRTDVTGLDRSGRERELARILGGVTVSELSLSAAAELLDRAEARKA